MPRYVPMEMLAKLQSGATTLAILIWFEPQRAEFDGYGVTEADHDIVYDPGDGARMFSSSIGVETSELHASADLAVDNGEAKQLMPVYDIPVSEETIAAGIYDYSRFAVYLVDYEDLTPGRHVVLHEGTVGKVSVRDDGLSFITELRGLAAQLKQEICTKYTKTCRAIEGTMPPGSPLPGEQVKRDWCGVDFTVYLKSATVVEVGLENTLSFKVDPIDADWAIPNFFVPGRVTFTVGRNTGRTLEIMSNTTDGWITLRHEAGFPIEVDDELEYRRGCSFIARDADKGCLHHAGAEWIVHFKGYPDIPTEDAAQLMTPGAATGGGDHDVPYSETAQQ